MFEKNRDRDRDRDYNRETLQFNRENREPWSRFLSRFLIRGRGFSYFRNLTATATATFLSPRFGVWFGLKVNLNILH